MNFDRPDRESPFLSFVAAEFRERGTPIRKALSIKSGVHELLHEMTLGGERIGLPRQQELLSSVDQITEEILGERSVLKFANGWSARGVMPLERIGDGLYFDHLGLVERRISNIRETQEKVAASFSHSEPSWIVEEFIEGPQPGEIPFDYKFYTFRSQIGMILQIDRNTSPPKMALFDGNFRPLQIGEDYLIASENAQPGIPVIPRSALKMARWAIHLAQQTDAPFVSVDLYDSTYGPVFGEFTFSPGATHRRFFWFGHHMLDRFDRLFEQATQEMNGVGVVLDESLSRTLVSLPIEKVFSYPELSQAKYSRLAAHLYNGGGRAALRLKNIYSGRLRDASDPGSKSLTRHMLDAVKAVHAHLSNSRKFSPSVRRDAVKAVLEGGYSVSEVAESIQIREGNLQKWIDADISNKKVAADPTAKLS